MFALKALLKCRSINCNRLDGGTRLSRCCCTIVEHTSRNFTTADHRFNRTCFIIHNRHSRLRLNDFLFQTEVFRCELLSILREEVRIIFKEVCTDNQIVIGITFFILLRNVQIAARNRVELTLFNRVHAFEFHAVVSLTLNGCVINRKAFSRVNRQRTVLVPLVFARTEFEVSLFIDIVGISIQHDAATRRVQDIAFAVRTVADGFGEVGINFIFLFNNGLSL